MQTAVRYIENSEYARFGKYLHEQHFVMIFVLALLLHGVAAAAYYLMPQEEVLEIPVRVLNVKLGGKAGAAAITSQDVNRLFAKRRLAKTPATAEAPTAQPEANPILEKVIESRPKTEPVKPDPVKKVEMPKPEPVVKKVEKPKPQPKVVETPEPKVARTALETPKPKAEVTPPPVVQQEPVKKTITPPKPPSNIKREVMRQPLKTPRSQTPKRYVRSQLTAKVGEKKSKTTMKRITSGSLLGNSSSKGAEIQKRYTQTISLWIDKHKVYPEVARAAGEGGKVILRVRINRQGRILRFLLEKSSGSEAIDRAITQMIDAANPLPAVPANYPDNKPYLEFLIPINFIP